MYETILLIDNDKDSLKEVRKVLELEGYVISTARNGLEGLRKIEKEKPNLVITDFMLPKLNGYELIQQLRQKKEYKRFPVIVMCTVIPTSLRYGHDRKQYPMSVYVPKPFIPEDLISTVRRLLEVKK